MLVRSEKALISLSAQLLAGHWPRRSQLGPKPKQQPEGGQLRQTSSCIPFGRFPLFLEARSEKPLAFVYRKTCSSAAYYSPPPPNYLTLPAFCRHGHQPCLPECPQTSTPPPPAFSLAISGYYQSEVARQASTLWVQKTGLQEDLHHPSEVTM